MLDSEPRFVTTAPDVEQALQRILRVYKVEPMSPENRDKLALLLHGFPEHAVSWRLQVPTLVDLGYSVWVPNLRGYGHSSRPQGRKAYSVRSLVGDVRALVDQAKKQQVLLVGHDFGAAIAWLALLQRACPVERMVSMNLFHPAMILRLYRFPQLMRSAYFGYFLVPGLAEYCHGVMELTGALGWLQRLAQKRGQWSPEVTRTYQQNLRGEGAMTAMLNYYRAAFDPRLWSDQELANITRHVDDVPVLMINGESDPLVGKEMVAGTGKLVSDLTVRFLPGVSHWAQQEAPGPVNQIISTWVKDEAVPDFGANGYAANRNAGR